MANLIFREMAEFEAESKPADPAAIAVIWVEKAQTGSLQWTSQCSEDQLNAYRLRKKLKPVTTLVKYCLLLLAFFEIPSWCLQQQSICPGKRTDMHAGGAALGSESSNVIATLFWVYLLYHSYLRRKALGLAHTASLWHNVAFTLVCVGLVDNLVAFVNHSGILFWTSFRISRIIRPVVFLGYTKKVREAANRVAKTIPNVLDVFLALGLCVFLFSWFGLILFADTNEGKDKFNTWEMAITNLYILFTTANCPDIFVEAYETHRMSFFFFFGFIILTVYLLSNVLLASIYDAYKEQLKGMIMTYYKNQEEAIQQAFNLLVDERGVVGSAKFAKFFTTLCDFEDLEDSHNEVYNRERANKIFKTMDADQSDGLDIDEFKFLLDIIQDSETYMPRRPPPKIHSSPWVKYFKHRLTEGVRLPGMSRKVPFDIVLDAVILLDVIIVFYQTALFVNGEGRFQSSELGPKHPWYWLLLGFSTFYVIVVSLKLYVFGWERYWHVNPVMNRYDFVTVYGIFLVEVVAFILDFSGGTVRTTTMMNRLVVALHISRSLRFIQYIDPLKFICNFVVRLTPTYYRMGMLLIVVYYIYAMIGQQWFGGLIYDSNPALVGTDFVANEYWSMNFNDFANSMVTLFVLMVINNWFVIAACYMKVSGQKYAAGAFFISFYIFVIMIVLNILMGLVLECNALVRDEMDREASGEAGGEKKAYSYEAVLRQVLLADEHHDDIDRSQSSLSRLASSSKSLGTASASAELKQSNA